ncbi:MAG: HEPN family nuclease [Saprospiraceae bacterium]
MGNYKNLEIDFIERTLNLISQYGANLHKYEFAQQYNYTLLINCLMGIIVMPKERIYSRLPNERLTKRLKNEMGLFESTVDSKIKNIRDLIKGLRNSIAHFSIEIISKDKNELIDIIRFIDTDEHGKVEGIVAEFKAEDLLPFIRYYGYWIISNLKKNE